MQASRLHRRHSVRPRSICRSPRSRPRSTASRAGRRSPAATSSPAATTAARCSPPSSSPTPCTCTSKGLGTRTCALRRTRARALLTAIVPPDPMYVYFEGDEHAYLRYQELARAGERKSSRDFANPVRIGLANEEGFPHEGHMDFVDNQLNVRTGTIRGRAVIDNKQGLFTPGMFARVQLLGTSEREAILIEERAI